MSLTALAHVPCGLKTSASEAAQANSIEAAPPPPHLRYMSGPRGELFRALVEAGILDPFGKVTAEYSNVTLPPLTPEELELVTRELERAFEITLDDTHKMHVTMAQLLRSFLVNTHHYRPDVYIRSTRLIGGYVSYLLFSQTDYAKRVFKALKIEHLYDERLFRKVEKGPADIDLRMHLEKRPYSYGHQTFFDVNMQMQDLEYLRDLVTWQLSYWFVGQQRAGGGKEPFHRSEAQSKIYFQAFSELCTIDTGFMQMQLFSLKESPVDWILYHNIPRECVYTVDDLFLPLAYVFNPDSDSPVCPESHRGKPLESFFHYVLGFTDAENIATIDEKGWFRYLSWIMKGNCCIYVPKRKVDPSLEAYLFSKVNSLWIMKDTTRVWKIQIEMEKWIQKHHPDDPLAALIFVLNTCLHLRGRLTDEQIQGILKEQLTKITLSEEEPLCALLKKLICEKNVSHETVASVLKLAAFHVYSRKSPTAPGIGVEVRTDSFTRPVLHLQVATHTVQLNLNLAEGIKHLANTPLEGVEEELAELFFLVCPPSDKQAVHQQEFLEDVGVDLEELTDPILGLAESEHPFLRYVGLVMVFCHPRLDPVIKQQFAERGLVSTLELASDKEAVRREFALFVGEGVIPPLDDERFLENWVRVLFAYGRHSEQTAFEMWKRLPPTPRSFTLIEELAHQQPGFALRLFMRMKLEDFPNEAFECVLACGQIVAKAAKKTTAHDQLVDYMEGKIPGLLDHKKHRKPEGAKKLSKSLNWYVQRSGSTAIARAGLRRSYFIAAQKKACIRLTLLSNLAEVFTQMPDSFSKAEILIKKGIARGLLTPKERVAYILKLYEVRPDSYDPTLFSALIDLGCSSLSLSSGEKEQIIEVIVTTLETQPFESMQRYVVGVERVVANLQGFIPTAVRRRLCIQCYLRKIDLPTSMNTFWFESLQEWCQEVRQEESPDLQMIYNLLLEGKKRLFAHDDAVLEVKLTLAEAWKDHSELASRSYTLMMELVPYLPSRVDRVRFYTLLGDLVLHKQEEVFVLLDKIRLKDPAPCYKLIIDPVLSHCFTFTHEKKSLQKLLHWLNRTNFFDGLTERDGFQMLLQEAFNYAVHFGAKDTGNKNWAKWLYTFTTTYIADLHEINSDIWDCFIALLERDDMRHLVEVYLLFVEHNVLEESDSVFFTLYAAALRAMTVDKDPRMEENVWNDLERHKRVCAFSTRPELLLFAHSYVVEAAVTYHTNSSNREAFVDSVTEIHALACDSMDMVKAKPEPEIDSLVLDRVESSIAFNYVRLLFRTQQYTEGKRRLREILDTTHTAAYWQQAGLLINDLVAIRRPLFLEEVDELLEFLDVTILPDVNVSRVVPFLLANSSKGRLIRASTLLRMALSSGMWKPGKENWDLIYRTMHGMLQEGEQIETMRLTLLITSLFSQFEKAVGDVFSLQAMEICMLNFARCTDPQYLNIFFQNVGSAIACLPVYYGKKGSEQVLDALPHGIVGLSRIHSGCFFIHVDAFMGKIVVRNSKTKRMKDKLALSRDNCFAIKRRLIELMTAALTPDHPFAEMLKQKTSDCLNAVIKDRAFKGKSKEIGVLLTSYQGAVKRLSSAD